jgi:small subunit ribosomal protein S9
MPTKKVTTKTAAKKEKYFQAVGRRKTAVARVRLFDKGDKSITVNEKDYKKYFPTIDLQQIIESPLSKMKIEEKFKVQAKVQGGGMHAQAEALRHGISRTLVKFNEDFKKRLRKAGFLTRDSRMRERKKFGLKRARRAPQWSKR